jgi:predicted branched-subunit amino acid permease
VAAAGLLIVSCFMPWYYLDWKNFTITGIEAGEKFGKPAYWHFVFTSLFLVLSFIQRIWAKQWNVFVAAINCAWMVRNFFALAMCSAGNCPQRQTGIWLLLISSVIMMLASLFPDMKIPQEKTS